jgi:plastocyanin
MRLFLKSVGMHAFLAALLLPATATAAELDVRISDGGGKAVADAVVTIRPLGRVALPVHAARRATIDQKDLAFVPYLEVMRPGDELVFRNSDRTRHHVYSFSKVRAFEFVLAPRESSPPMLLERSGVVAVGCNIHDQMIAYLYVTDAPWFARSDASGQVRFDALPAGEYEVRAWQPRMRPGSEEPRRRVVLAAAGSQALAFPLTLLPDPRRMPGREHAHY